MGRATVKDVAARAGVSPKTVSNVMNATFPVAPATRARVEQAMAGDRPRDMLARRAFIP